jgi:hypothetical protein
LCHWRVLWRLSPCFCLFSVFVDIESINVTVQAHASELHSSPVHSVIPRHDNCFLLLLH